MVELYLIRVIKNPLEIRIFGVPTKRRGYVLYAVSQGTAFLFWLPLQRRKLYERIGAVDRGTGRIVDRNRESVEKTQSVDASAGNQAIGRGGKNLQQRFFKQRGFDEKNFVGNGTRRGTKMVQR